MAAKQNMSVEADKSTKTYTIKLPKDHGTNALNTEFFSINGKDYLVQKGVPVEVPEELYNLIQDNLGLEEAADLYSEEAAQKVQSI